MATIQGHIANEQQLMRCYGATEVTLGVLLAPTYRLYGDLALNRSRPLADRNEFAGTYFKDYTPVRGAALFDGTYAQNLTYEDAPILCRYAVAGGGAGVSDTESTPGYVYTQEPNATRKNIDFMAGEMGFPGIGPYQFTGLHFPELTISGDIDSAEACWMWNSRVLALSKSLKATVTGAATGGSTTTVVKSAAGWSLNAYAGAYVRMTGGTAGNIGKVRLILSNDATTLTLDGALPSAVASADTFEIDGIFTAGIGDRARETIEFPGTKLYMDALGAIGTTLVNGRFISFSITYAINSATKRFAEDIEIYSRYGFGATVVTGQVRLEFDSRAEYEAWVAGDYSAIRIEQEGSVIDSGAGTKKLARIDIYASQFDAYTTDTRDNNITATVTFRGFVDTTEGIPASFTWKNKLAVLP